MLRKPGSTSPSAHRLPRHVPSFSGCETESFPPQAFLLEPFVPGCRPDPAIQFPRQKFFGKRDSFFYGCRGASKPVIPRALVKLCPSAKWLSKGLPDQTRSLRIRPPRFRHAQRTVFGPHRVGSGFLFSHGNFFGEETCV